MGNKFDPFDKIQKERDFRTEYTESLKNEGIKAEGNLFNNEKVRKETRNWEDITRDYANAAVLVPVGAWSFSEALSFPDFDISMLGIGNHRFFLFHSAASAWALKTLYEANFEPRKDNETFEKSKCLQEYHLGRLLGSFWVIWWGGFGKAFR